MRKPTTEQQAVLDNKDRVRVIRAVPGSGKTWLVAELIRKELNIWKTKESGIAALSFTRVGGDEIRQALGHDLEHPHFVGTIDAFIFRYIIRPHFHNCFPMYAVPRLIPGEWGAEHWNYYGMNQSVTVGKGINLFSCVFINEEQNKPVIAHKPHSNQPIQRLKEDEYNLVRDGKKRLWEKSGCITHSDAAFLASKILSHQKYGSVIRAEIVRRFPLLIVDELQDTGFFLGRCLQILLAEKLVRGVLVGDPDQAIFEFNGARPDLFKEFESIEGSTTLSLANSRRCPSSIAKAASYLKDSPGTIGPADNIGQAFLIQYHDMKADVEKIVNKLINEYSVENIRIITRSNETVAELNDNKSQIPPRLYCPTLHYIQLAVINFRQGHQVAALAFALTSINLAIFKHEGVTDEELSRYNIDPFSWKALGILCMFRVNGINISCSIFEWQEEAGNIIDSEIHSFRLNNKLNYTSGTLKPQKREGWDKISSSFIPLNSSKNLLLNSIPIQTVHAVKGQTHDVTIFVCPSVIRSDRCPSVIWWSMKDKEREEKRIAYVAMTRSQNILIVCVSTACFQRLASRHPLFVDSFTCKTTDEYVDISKKVT
jgi:DNA helicase II / ATP-dependent DNA helicase PcrA